MSRITVGIPTEYGFELPALRHEWAMRFLHQPDAALLDFGCGNGANTVLFAGDVRQAYGVDVEPDRVAEARAHATAMGLSNVSYDVYDGRTLPFPAQTFDVVVSFEVLEHTHDDREALAEIRRVLKPAGLLVLSVPNKWYLMETHGFDLPPRTFKWNRVPLLSWLPTPIHERYAHARIYSYRRLRRLLEAEGFAVLEHDYLMPPLDRLADSRWKPALKRLSRRLQRTPARTFGVAHLVAARPVPGAPGVDRTR